MQIMIWAAALKGNKNKQHSKHNTNRARVSGVTWFNKEGYK